MTATATKKKTPAQLANMNVGGLNTALTRGTPEERREILAKMRELEAQWSDEVPVEPDPAPVVAAVAPKPPVEAVAEDGRKRWHDFSGVRERLEHDRAQQLNLLERTLDRSERINAAIRITEIKGALERVAEAEFIAPVTRRYGCENQRELVTLDGYLPDNPVRFNRFTYETSDPIEIAFIEHRMRQRREANEWPTAANAGLRSSKEIRDIGDQIALVDFIYRANFWGFATPEQAAEHERRSHAISARKVRH